MRSLLPLALLLGGILLTGCGDDLPPLPHHGLVLGALDASPRGDPVAIGHLRMPTALEASIDVEWQIVRDGGPEETGRAHVAIDQQIERQDGRLVSTVAVRVTDPTGVASRFLKGLDGMRLTVEHDDAGRVRPATFVFLTPAPPEAVRWLHDLWLGGFGPGRSWLPGRPVRAGEVWPRADLGGVETIRTVDGIEMPPVRSSGGARLDEVLEDREGTRLARLTLEALLEAEGHLRHGVEVAAVSVGHLAWGVAILRVEDGVPRSWTYRDRTRYIADDGVTRQDVDLVTNVVGEVTTRGD